MDEASIQEFEQRTERVEHRLKALESRVDAGNIPASTGAVNVDKYVGELQNLREVLVKALSEQQALENRVIELETTNRKLAYQVKHLKRSLNEADAEKESLLASKS